MNTIILSIEIDNFLKQILYQLFFLLDSLILPATAVAHAAVPQAFVSPAPLSQTLTFIKLLFTTLASVTLHFSGKIYDFQFLVQFFLNSNLQYYSTKKIICGFPTFTAVPPYVLYYFYLDFNIKIFSIYIFT